MRDEIGSMRVEDLHNYGTNMHDLATKIPKKIARKAQKVMFSALIKELGLVKAVKLLLLMRKKNKVLSQNKLDHTRTFCKNEDFLRTKVSDAATFAALQELTNPEEAVEIYKRVMEKVIPLMESSLYPDPELIKNFENQFEIVKQYILSIMEADEKEGLHKIEIVENTPDVLQFNVTRCAWFESQNELGVPEATIKDCYADEISLPGLLSKVNVKFSRTQTIASGAKFCDFRFERIK